MRLTILKGLTHKVFLICLLLTSFQLSSAQLEGFKARAFMEQDGLAQNTVHVVMQDSKGFVWLGMRTGGLDRFDGYNFVRHRYNPYDSCSISGNEVASIMECSEGYIWVGTRERGLNKYDPRTNKFKVYNFSKDDTTTLPAQNIYALVEDKIGQIWVGTSWGLCVYNRKTDNFLRLFKKKGNKNSYYRGISDIILVDDKRVLVATNENGLFMIDCESKEIVKNWKHDPNDPRSLNSVKLAKMLKDKDGQIWCGTPKSGLNRLKNLDSNEFDHFVHDPQNKSTIGPKDVRGIMQDSKGNIWVSGPSGISIIPSTETQNQVPTFKRYTESPYDVNSLSQNALYTVCEDRDGDFWTGTWSNGVNFIKTQSVNFKNYQYIKNNKRSTNLPYVRNIHQHKNKLYVAVQGGGMNVLNLHTGIYKYYTQDYKNPEKSICSHSAEYFLQLDDENIAVGTNGGLNYFNIERESFSLNLEGNIVRDLEMDKDSNLWVASQKGLYILDTNEKGLNPLKYKDEDYRSIANTARVLFKDSKDRMWVGASYGLKMYRDTAQLDHQFIYEKNDESSISANFINTIAEDKNNNIWVGTSDGLNLYREDSVDFIRYGEWDGLPINEIHNVFSDDNGLIWISTIKGLTSFRYNKDAKTKAESLSDFTTYTVDDGLQGNSFTTNCVFKADDGNIYMGGMNGFNSFAPEKMVINNIKPKVAFTGFKLFNKAVGIGTKDSPLSQDIAYIDELELNHKQGSFTIEYSALNYTASQKCNYKYRMDGHEEEWNEVGTRREANYSNLRAGDYTFMVKASNNDGLWSDQPTTLKVIIKPAWWNTWWFRLLVVLLISAIIYYVIKRRTQEAKERRRELEEKVREATAESERKNAELADAQVKLSGVIEDVKLKLGKTSTKLLEATNSQASSIEEVSASIDQMVNEINENATGTAKMFDNAQVVENNSAESVSIFSKAVGSIEDVAKGIQSITEFARTTNLLSLNAAIEAAKAGEHGRSFGVVANEVKKLADSSQEVAVEIKKLSNNGLDLSHEANEKIVALQGYIKDIVGLISQIRSSTQSQSYEASNVNTAIQQISNYVSDTANLAEQLDEAIKSLSLEE